MAGNIRENLALAAEIISYLMNETDPAHWGPYSQQDLSDGINTCFSCAGLLELQEIERRQREKGITNESK